MLQKECLKYELTLDASHFLDTYKVVKNVLNMKAKQQNTSSIAAIYYVFKLDFNDLKKTVCSNEIMLSCYLLPT